MAVDPKLFPKVGDYINAGLSREVLISILMFFFGFAEQKLGAKLSATGAEDSTTWVEFGKAAMEEAKGLSGDADGVKKSIVSKTDFNAASVKYFNKVCVTYARVGGGIANFCRIALKLAGKDSSLSYIAICLYSILNNNQNSLLKNGINNVEGSSTVSNSSNFLLELFNKFENPLEIVFGRKIKTNDLLSPKTFNFHGEMQMWIAFDPTNTPKSKKEAVEIFPQKGYSSVKVIAYGLTFSAYEPLFSEPWVYQTLAPKKLGSIIFNKLCILALFRNAAQEAEKIHLSNNHTGNIFHSYLGSMKHCDVPDIVKEIARDMLAEGFSFYMTNAPKLISFSKTLRGMSLGSTFTPEEAAEFLKNIA